MRTLESTTRCWRSRKLRLFGHVVTRLKAKGTPSCRVLFRGKIKRKACRWLDDVNEWTGLSSNEMWMEHAEDRVAWIQHVSRVAKTDRIVYAICNIHENHVRENHTS